MEDPRLVTDTPRWRQRPPGSNWGDFGPDDQLGRLNFLTEQKVLEGAAEIKTGKRFCLSLPLDLPGGSVINPRRKPPVLGATKREDGRLSMNYPFRLFDATCTDVVCDDYVTLYLQYSTQWDGFAHNGQWFDADADGIPEIVYYNGFRAKREVVGLFDYTDGQDRPVPDAKPGVWKLGAENFASTPIQGRGVLIDIEAHFGRGHRAVGYQDLAAIMDRDGIEVRKGDIVLFRTGYAQALVEMAGAPDRKALRNFAELDGSDERLLNWVTDSGVAAMAADNYTFERAIHQRPEGANCSMIPLHELCLFKLGIPIGELWYLTELAEWLRGARRSAFMLTAPGLRLPGTAGTPLTPVATV